MPHAFYLPTEQWSTQCSLHGQEAMHAAHSLRMKAGEQLIILDGKGRRGECEIESINRFTVRLRLINDQEIPRPQSLPIMALAWSKFERRGFFMEKAVELGVHEIWLWTGEYSSQGRIPPKIKEHWQAQCIAGMKQCHNPWIPNIRILTGGIKELIEHSSDIEQRLLLWEVQESVPMLTPKLAGKPGKTLYTIGPEGGFSGNEIQSFYQSGFRPMSLGNRVLRCETAALLCLGIHWWASQLQD